MICEPTNYFDSPLHFKSPYYCCEEFIGVLSSFNTDRQYARCHEDECD
jgi:hypothetical protein